jgi:hypothetical protein
MGLSANMESINRKMIFIWSTESFNTKIKAFRSQFREAKKLEVQKDRLLLLRSCILLLII